MKHFLEPVQHLFRAAHYTRVVIFGRGLLWVMILAILSLLVYSAVSNSTSDGARLVFSEIKQMADLENVMKDLHYHGLDKNNLPYSVLATKAVQKDLSTVVLENIQADMNDKSGKWLALRAGTGELNTKDKTLLLTKNIDMFYDGGYEFKSEQVAIDIDRGSARGTHPITGQGPMGTLQADQFLIQQRGQTILFEGRVKVVLYR